MCVLNKNIQALQTREATRVRFYLLAYVQYRACYACG